MSITSTQTWSSELSRTSAEQFVRKVRSLLNGQEITAAKAEAARGAELFPENLWLTKANRVLNPTKVTTSPAHDRGVDHGKELDWLRQNRQEYQGRWVVLLGGELLACADTYEDVMGTVRALDLPAQPLVHHVE